MGCCCSSANAPRWEQALTATWPAFIMQVEWHGWQDDAKVSVHVRDERGMVVAAIEGGQTDNKLDRAHVISPSGEVFTADLGHIDVSATRNIERIKLFSKRRHKLTYFLGGYVRQGGTERSSIWHSDADMGVFPARISLKCDGSRIRVWRGKRPDADLQMDTGSSLDSLHASRRSRRPIRSATASIKAPKHFDYKWRRSWWPSHRTISSQSLSPLPQTSSGQTDLNACSLRDCAKVVRAQVISTYDVRVYSAYGVWQYARSRRLAVCQKAECRGPMAEPHHCVHIKRPLIVSLSD